MQRHRIAEIAFLVGAAPAVETDELGILHQLLDFLELRIAGQHTQMPGMPVIMLAVLAFLNHDRSPFFNRFEKYSVIPRPRL